MANLNVIKGYWQIACAKDVMINCWRLIKQFKYSRSVALKNAWREMKNLINKISNSYAEYKYKLKINDKSFILCFKTNDLDEVVEQALEKIAELKGKKFIYSISNNIYSRYDYLLNTLKVKGTLTFAKNVFIIRI